MTVILNQATAMSLLACPIPDELPVATRGHYLPEPPTEDAPAAFAAAVAREEGAKTMLSALQEAGVKVPLSTYTAVVRPLLSGYQRAWMNAVPGGQLLPDPLNEARLIAERTA